jgi:exopolyphosphatase/pppGpp-phosphohydrolase
VLAERHFRHDPPTASELAAARRDVVRTLDLQLGPVGEIALATGGSARGVGRLAGRLVGKEELGAALEHAISSRKPAKNQRRRRSLPAGILILDALHSAIEMPLTIAASGLREGVLLHLAEVGSRAHAFDLAAMPPRAA